MVGIHNIQLGYSYGALDRVCLLDRLKDTGEGASKLHGLRGDLPDCGLIHTCRPFVDFFQQGQYDLQPSVLLGNRRNLGQLEFFPE